MVFGLHAYIKLHEPTMYSGTGNNASHLFIDFGVLSRGHVSNQLALV